MPQTYSQQKVPPAPVLSVRLSRPGEPTPMEPKLALIDTGGDFTTAPLSWLLAIDAPEFRWAYLRGLWSEQRPVTLYLVDVHLENGLLPGMEVIGIPDEEIETEEDYEIVLGRNILNRLLILLDGPSKQVNLLERRPLKF